MTETEIAEIRKLWTGEWLDIEQYHREHQAWGRLKEEGAVSREELLEVARGCIPGQYYTHDYATFYQGGTKTDTFQRGFGKNWEGKAWAFVDYHACNTNPRKLPWAMGRHGCPPPPTPPKEVTIEQVLARPQRR
jgi:hypothetical protein